jgi:hypothetical protein
MNGYQYEDCNCHPWCSDSARDIVVRAAEDKRTGPLPTLEEAIAQAFAAAPQPTSGWLTAEERGSIQHAANLAKANWSYSVAQELENILASSKAPEVEVPHRIYNTGSAFWTGWNEATKTRDEQWLAALAVSGVKAKGVDG